MIMIYDAYDWSLIMVERWLSLLTRNPRAPTHPSVWPGHQAEPTQGPVFGRLAKGEARRNLMEYCKR